MTTRPVAKAKQTTHSRLFHGALLLVAGAILATTASADDDCRERMDITDELELDGISEISIEAGAGKLIVLGQQGLTTAQLDGRACATDEDDVQQISLETRIEGSTLVLRTEIPEPSKSFFGNSYARLDLEVRIPNSYPIQIVDTSGSMSVSSVASVQIKDGSGSIQIQDVTGEVNITDDGSGSITVVRAGSVRIGEDGSGSITASQIMNDVYVGSDGSGSISAKDVGGSFTVVSDTGGSIRHRNVAGIVQIDED
ncbi:MAG: DUF2807 domain-containing protein [Pseudomonadota bacterium]